MRSRVVMLLCAVCMVFTLTACNVEQTKNTEQTKNAEGVEYIDVNGRQVKRKNYDRLYECNPLGEGVLFSFHCPGADWQSQQFASYVMRGGNMEIAVTTYIGDIEGLEYDNEFVDITKHKDSTDVVDVLLPGAIRDASGTGKTVKHDMEILFTEEINGVEMTKFQGNVYVTSEWGESVYPSVAYGIKGSTRPILVIAMQTSTSNGKNSVDEWMYHIDDLVATFQDGE